MNERPLTVLTLDDVLARLASADAGREPEPEPEPEPEIGEVRWTLREAVCLSDRFLVGDLPDVGTDDDRTGFVLADCERTVGVAGGGWRLRADVRAETLQRLGTPGAVLKRSRPVDGTGTDPARSIAERYLRGPAPDLEQLTPEELAVTLRVVGWLTGTVAGIAVPNVAEVSAALDLAGLLVPLRAVADDHFVGRRSELLILERYLRGPRPAGPLTIDAVGGMGKSTLIAHFLLTHVAGPSRSGRRPPFVYLSFDRADLRPDRSSSLLGEAARQLAVQRPRLAGELADIRGACAAIERFEISRSGEVASSSRGSEEISSRTTRDESALIHRFGELTPNRQLWVLDTFELAQRRGLVAMSRVRQFLDELTAALPQVRVVVAGRAPITELPGGPRIPLGRFDRTSARRFLADRLAGVPVPRGLVAQVAELAGGVPLSLRLAADLIRRQGEVTPLTRADLPALFAGLEVEQVQGILYRRTLEHIADPQVQRLANPGMVVRRITPDLLRAVLAPVCGLGRIDRTRADALFRALASEVSLVEQPSHDVLVHREDVRRMVLPLIAAADRDAYEKVNRAAVRYYARRPDPTDRVEELYHRLLLDEPGTVLDRHWDASVAQLLMPAIDELPQAARAFLADRLRLTATVDELAAADDATWLRQALREARRLADDGDPEAALTLIRSRPTAPISIPLMVLEAQVLVTLDDIGGALDVLDRATAGGAGIATDEIDVLAALMLKARILQDAGQLQGSLVGYSAAREIARRRGLVTEELSAAVGMLRVHRLLGSGDTDEARGLRSDLLAQVGGLDRKQRLSNPSLLRELAAEVGSQDGDLLIDAVRYGGLDVMGEGADLLTSEGLGAHVQTIQQEVLGADSGRLTSAEQGAQVADYLRKQDDGGTVTTALADIYQREVDREAYRYRK